MEGLSLQENTCLHCILHNFPLTLLTIPVPTQNRWKLSSSGFCYILNMLYFLYFIVYGIHFSIQYNQYALVSAF